MKFGTCEQNWDIFGTISGLTLGPHYVHCNWGLHQIGPFWTTNGRLLWLQSGPNGSQRDQNGQPKCYFFFGQFGTLLSNSADGPKRGPNCSKTLRLAILVSIGPLWNVDKPCLAITRSPLYGLLVEPQSFQFETQV